MLYEKRVGKSLLQEMLIALAVESFVLAGAYPVFQQKRGDA